MVRPTESWYQGAIQLNKSLADGSDTGDDNLFLVAGGPGYLTSVHPEGCVAWLMDRQGTVRHVWKYAPELWDDLEKVAIATTTPDFRVFGLHLYDDGSLLTTFQCPQAWRFCYSLGRPYGTIGTLPLSRSRSIPLSTSSWR